MGAKENRKSGVPELSRSESRVRATLPQMDSTAPRQTPTTAAPGVRVLKFPPAKNEKCGKIITWPKEIKKWIFNHGKHRCSNFQKS